MKPLAGRGKFVVLAFVVLLVIYVIAAWADFDLVNYLKGIESGGPVDRARAEAIDTRRATIGIGQLVVFLACVISFLVWIHRAYANLAASGLRGLKSTPGWAVGGFFIPILNLVRPYTVMTEIWSGSVYLSTYHSGVPWQRVPRNPMVIIWWLTYLGASILGRVADRTITPAEGVRGLISTTYSDLVFIAAQVVAAALALLLVRQVTAMQEKALSAPAVAKEFE
jgi:hypothetical protein